jgi:hypothetical protein
LLFAVFVTGFTFVVTDERVDDELDGVKFGELDDEEMGRKRSAKIQSSLRNSE